MRDLKEATKPREISVEELSRRREVGERIAALRRKIGNIGTRSEEFLDEARRGLERTKRLSQNV